MKHKKTCSDPRVHVELFLSVMGMGVIAVLASFVGGGTLFTVAVSISIVAAMFVFGVSLRHIRDEHL